MNSPETGKALAKKLAQHTVVLMRGHGDTVVGENIRDTVQRAIYTERNAQLLLLREIMIEGIISIQAGDNPRLLEEKLHAFLDPTDRETEIEEGGVVGEAAPAATT